MNDKIEFYIKPHKKEYIRTLWVSGLCYLIAFLGFLLEPDAISFIMMGFLTIMLLVVVLLARATYKQLEQEIKNLYKHT